MGKKCVIMKVQEKMDETIYFEPINYEFSDGTWIDPRHVIDGDRLRYGVPSKGETYLEPVYDDLWCTEDGDDANLQVLILDPPKPEGDELTKWIGTMPDWLLETETAEAIRTLLRKMPRKP